MWQILGVLFICGLILEYWGWIVAAVAVYVAFRVAKRVIADTEAAAQREAARQAAISARADEQHQWVMQGDPKGMYSAEAMPTIRKYQRVSG